MTWSSPVPVGTRQGSNFGNRGGSFHAGDDYPPKKSGQQGVDVYAIGDGTVIGTGANLLRGHSGDRNVLIQHPGGVLSYYGHLNSERVSVGQRVKAGQHIGEMGYRGNVIPSGPGGTHLHLGIIVNGKFVDPSAFLSSKGITVGKTAPVKASAPAPSKPKGDAKVLAWQKRQNYYGKAGLYPDGIKGPYSKAWESWVKKAQNALNHYKGVLGEVVKDGDYGPKFNAQVREVQSRNGLHVDGFIGPVMIKWLNRQGSNLPSRPDTRP